MENEAQLELTKTPLTKAEKLEKKREDVLNAVNSCRLNTIEEKVAWILNCYPKTRDSDIALQIKYWQSFENKYYDGGLISIRDYYRLTRLTTLTRARATIQNQLKLFQASDAIKVQRKQLQKDQHAHARKRRANFHRYTVYLDETGKTQDHLAVGSMWFLDGTQTLRIYQEIQAWKANRKFSHEIHFKEITESKLPLYLEIADLIAANCGTVSFKVISVPRNGVGDVRKGLLQLTYHLLVRGIEHEHSTGRAILPRGIQVVKDSEEEGHDKLFAAELADKMKQVASTTFNDELYIEDFSAESSEGNLLLQLTDLFVSSVGRQLNVHGDKKQPKDKFADYFLGRLGIRVGQQDSESMGDLTVHISL